MSGEPEWKKTTLSLERPYKDDSGVCIPVLLDITPEGEQVVEPYGSDLSSAARWLTRGIESKILPHCWGKTLEEYLPNEASTFSSVKISYP